MAFVVGAFVSAALAAASVPSWVYDVDPMGWTFLAATADNTAVLFWQPSLAQAPTDQVWVRIEFERDTANPPQLSWSQLSRIDCQGARIMRMQYTTYAGRNLTGSPTQTIVSRPEWTFASPNTINAALLKAVCK